EHLPYRRRVCPPGPHGPLLPPQAAAASKLTKPSLPSVMGDQCECTDRWSRLPRNIAFLPLCDITAERHAIARTADSELRSRRVRCHRGRGARRTAVPYASTSVEP